MKNYLCLFAHQETLGVVDVAHVEVVGLSYEAFDKDLGVIANRRHYLSLLLLLEVVSDKIVCLF